MSTTPKVGEFKIVAGKLDFYIAEVTERDETSVSLRINDDELDVARISEGKWHCSRGPLLDCVLVDPDLLECLPLYFAFLRPVTRLGYMLHPSVYSATCAITNLAVGRDKVGAVKSVTLDISKAGLNMAEIMSDESVPSTKDSGPMVDIDEGGTLILLEYQKELYKSLRTIIHKYEQEILYSENQTT